MCNRLLITAKDGAALATFNGVPASVVSVDTRCAMTLSNDPTLLANLISFADSDKPGVLVNIGSGNRIAAVEFTDAMPEGALAINFIEPANNEEQAESQPA